MKFEIKHRWTGKLLFELEVGSLRLALEAAVKAETDLKGADLKGAYLKGADLKGADLKGADLKGAYLKGADLEGADLEGADLEGADLKGAKNLRIPTGETWDEYLTETVPALLTAGGKKLEEVATAEHWNCHDWDNCPMATAFGVKRLEDVPILYRPRAEQFVMFFDARQIPLEKINQAAAKDGGSCKVSR